MTTEIDLACKYAAAWGEHATRVEQRQAAVQIYLGSAAVIFGFYFNRLQGNAVREAWFLLIGVTFLTVFTSSLLFLHHRVIQNLTSFLRRCELAADDIAKG